MVRKRADAKVLCVRHVTCARPIVLRCRRQPCVTPRQESNTSICSVLHLRYCAWRSGFSAAGASNEDLDSAREPLTCGLPTPAPSYVWGARTRAPGSPPQRAVSLIMSSHAGCRALSRSGMQADWQPGVSCRARDPRQCNDGCAARGRGPWRCWGRARAWARRRCCGTTPWAATACGRARARTPRSRRAAGSSARCRRAPPPCPTRPPQCLRSASRGSQRSALPRHA